MKRKKAVAKPKSGGRSVRGNQNLSATRRDFYQSIAEILRAARANAYRAVNFAMVEAYWNVGRMIVEEEQQGKERAEYGAALIKNLSVRLCGEFGKGFTESNLWNFRQFYLAFPAQDPRNQKLYALRRELTWTHYRLLMRVGKPDARAWYLKEAADQNWSTRALERQINSLYYERLLMSRDKAAVTEEMQQKTVPLAPTPQDFIKDPYVLEFLGIPDAHEFREAELEQAIIGKLQTFMLELGKGFAFVARQQRISTETKDFFVDLVFYNYILKCFVLVDLKTGELTHQDIGQIHPVRYCHEPISLRVCSSFVQRWELLCRVFQRLETTDQPTRIWEGPIYRRPPASRTCLLRGMPDPSRCHQARKVSQDRLGQTLHKRKTRKLSHGVNMYVRLFEDTAKGADDNPTVGIILCTEKDHTVVKYSVLNENKQLFASKYMLYLPTEEALREELERERALVVREQSAQYAVALHV